MDRRPLAAIACCWIAGSGMAYLYHGKSFWLLWGGITLIVPLIAVSERITWKRLLVLWLALSIGAAYWAYNDVRNVSGIESILEQDREIVEPEEVAVHVEGTILSPLDIDGDRADFTLKISGMSITDKKAEVIAVQEQKLTHSVKEKIAVQIRLSSEQELLTAASWQRGQRLVISGVLERPGSARNFGGFDYRNYLRNQRIHWLLKAKGADSITLVKSGTYSPSALLGKMDALRDSLGSRVDELFPDWQGGYMKGLIIGLSDELEPEKYAQFTNLGLTHILAISGSHVAINVGLLFGLLRLCRVTRETSLAIVMSFVPVYVLLTGLSPSVIRSGIMTLLGLYLLRRGLMKDGLNVLSAAALMMLLWEPYYLLNVSFQLSFAVTAGLILFVPLLTPYLLWLPQRIRGAVAITVAAQIVSFPLTIYYFNQFSLLSLAANLAIVPLVSLVALPLGTAALLVSGLWLQLGQWIAYPVRLINSFTFMATEWLSSLTGFMTYWKSPSLLWIAAFYALVYLLFARGTAKLEQSSSSVFNDETVPLPVQPDNHSPPVLRENNQHRSWKRTAITGTLLVGLTAMMVYGYQPANVKGTGHVQFIDVGQGDCALITSPAGINILVDGGGTVSFRKPGDAWRDRREPFEVGAKTVAPLLKKRGIHRLHAVILTHGDQDHIGGLQAVIEQFPVDALIMNGTLAESATMSKLMATAIAKGIPIYAAHSGMRLEPDHHTTIDFLAPTDESVFTSVSYIKDQNHHSIVFQLEMAGATFLFTGDMDVSAELKVLGSEKFTKENSRNDEGLITGLSGNQLLPQQRRDRQVDVMKIAHHGSKTSTSWEWLDRFRPAASIISVGASNSYGHPNADVLQRLEDIGSTIYRSDQLGEIQIQVKRGKMVIRHKM